MLRPAASLAVVGTLVTAIVAGLPPPGCSTSRSLEGLLVGSILASTDGAAIFAVLRGSTLRRRLARTLEGEAGLQRPGRGPARARLHRVDPGARTTASLDMVGEFVLRAGHRPRGRARGRLAGRAGAAAHAAGVGGPVSRRLAGDRGARLRRRRRPARLRLPRRLPRRARARVEPRSRPSARSRPSTPASAGSRRSSCSSSLGLLVFPSRARRRVRSRARCSPWSSCSWRGRSASSPRRSGCGFTVARADRAGLGRPARGGARRARDLRGHRGRARQRQDFFNIAFFAVLVSTLVQGATFERARAPARRDHGRGRAARPRCSTSAPSAGSAPR